ncbi:hypothetical protein RND71_023397 [Anisodus tanguticus]|uniref:Uncharacterized protein n=1 Tax=Anisodus tanguticus TaxID=243964 RepID=A0AAE1V6X8_9SOLA|nr:hypothetical protein RND71_023397 [Anisodus tanguticus]
MDIAIKADVAAGEVNIMIEKNQAFSDMNKVPKINVASSSRKVTHVLQYVATAKKGDEDEENVRSSYHIAIKYDQSTSHHARIEGNYVDIHTYHNISFNDGDPQEDKDTKDAPLEFEEGDHRASEKRTDKICLYAKKTHVKMPVEERKSRRTHKESKTEDDKPTNVEKNGSNDKQL